ncbi:hypothetical protein B0A79_12355 [Flavobacterium piscis]|uniref:Uncharacterized protein n=1 Tax=Flavobacterium piscis TaxID=1114874 RepID=A0ABX2XQE4_9FLAO|nr:hypothetical protein [Flavobacterium piscis]OCB78332.1 hypothetical protein FLP_01120 [Flavobacterium piscis]OXG04254.1 hypothetical protein B0A79_12355 [Flavobacterium piscis]
MEILIVLLGIITALIILYFGLAFILIQIRRPKFNNKGYTKLEKRLLDIFTSMFDPNLADKIKMQIEYFENKRKWRKYWEKSMSIDLYGDKKMSPNLKYPRRDESKIATIRFKVNEEKYSIEFNSYDGRIWGWKIRPNPKGIQKTDNIEVISKKIYNDLNEKVVISIEKTEFKTIPNFDGVIGEVSKVKPIKTAFNPLIPQQIEIFKRKIDTVLPNGYIKIIEQTEGLEFDDFRISGISEMQRTGLDDGDYFHLVEFDDGIIAVKENDKNGELYFCHFSGGLTDKLGTDFDKILKERTT